jgi:glucose/mannose-6-phosphate isomerase
VCSAASESAEAILDDPAVIGKLDSENMLGHINGLPRQVADAWAIGSSVRVPESYADVECIVTFGMGGSAIGADLTRTVVEPSLRVPMLTVRDYACPSFVGPRTLVIAASYSGETEETISALKQARDRGARCLVISTGGTVTRMARESGLPLFSFVYQSQPRAAVGFSLMLPLAALSGLGLAPKLDADVGEAVRLLQTMNSELAPEQPFAANEAKQIAAGLAGRIAVIYGGALAEVARRWKGQLNENAKHWAFYEALPEMNHNAVVPFEDPAGLNGKLAVVELTSTLEHPRTAVRFGAIADLMESHGISWRRAAARGTSRLAQVLSAVYLGDWASYYVALLNGTDPTPIGPINELKRRLSATAT